VNRLPDGWTVTVLPRLAGAALVCLLVVACSTPTPAAPSAGAAPVVITDATRSEVQAVLQTRQQALSTKDLNGFQSTLDMTRPALRRCQQETFDIATRQGATSQSPAVGRVELYLDNYVRAYVEEGSGYARVYFKRDGASWVITEPKENELGGERTKTVGGLELSYWGIDEDIIDGFAQAGLETKDFLLKLARTPPTKAFALRMFPTREAAGLTAGCTAVGTTFGAPTGDPYLRFYRYWTGADFKNPSEAMRSFLRHEGLHWLQEQTSPGINARLDWWLVEGWPDYIGQSRSAEAKSATVCRTPTPTFKQLVDGPDADPYVTPERSVQFYSFANTMIEYLYATFPDETYWDLMKVYKETIDTAVTYPRVLGITPEQLYADWLVYAKRKYC
jgi:hypothetical protein